MNALSDILYFPVTLTCSYNILIILIVIFYWEITYICGRLRNVVGGVQDTEADGGREKANGKGTR